MDDLGEAGLQLGCLVDAGLQLSRLEVAGWYLLGDVREAGLQLGRLGEAGWLLDGSGVDTSPMLVGRVRLALHLLAGRVRQALQFGVAACCLCA